METKTVPFIEIEIDRGEKNRQKIDELLRAKQDKLAVMYVNLVKQISGLVAKW